MVGRLHAEGAVDASDVSRFGDGKIGDVFYFSRNNLSEKARRGWKLERGRCCWFEKKEESLKIYVLKVGKQI